MIKQTIPYKPQNYSVGIYTSGAITDLKPDNNKIVKALYKDILVRRLSAKTIEVLPGWYEFKIYDYYPFLWFFTRRKLIRTYTIHPMYTKVEWARTNMEET